MLRKFLSWCGDCIGDNEDHKNKTESESDNESNSEYEYSDSDCHIDEEQINYLLDIIANLPCLDMDCWTLFTSHILIYFLCSYFK